MKKLLVVLSIVLLGVISFNLLESYTPQDGSIPIVTYKIDTTGYSNGLEIPAPFYFCINSLCAEIDPTTGFNLYSYSYNLSDTINEIKILNDSIPSLKKYPMSITDVDTMTLDQMVESYIKKNLEDIYGVNNISKIE